jgi:GAF domain-containing protein
MASTALRDIAFPAAVAPVTAALRDVARRCGAAVPGTTGCCVSLLSTDGRRLTTEGTDAVAERLGALYDVHARNACATAWSGNTVVRTHSDCDVRWPLWWAAVRETGAQSVMVAPLRTAGRLLGTCLVYSTLPRAYDEGAALALSAIAGDAATRIDRSQDRRV